MPEFPDETADFGLNPLPTLCPIRAVEFVVLGGFGLEFGNFGLAKKNSPHIA